MKNLLRFYLAIFIPLIFIVLLVHYYAVTSRGFVALLVIYAFVYHPYVSGKRLLAIHEIDQEEFWKNFIPLWNIKYLPDLFFLETMEE